MNRRSRFEQIAFPALALTAGCFLDTAPIAEPEASTTSPVQTDASNWQPQQTEADAAIAAPQTDVDAGTSTGQAPPSVPVMDAAVQVPSMPADAASGDAGTPTVTPPLPASSGGADAGAGTPPPTLACASAGSYGLRAVLDVWWEGTAGADAGRGSVELLGLLQVDAADPLTGATPTRFRACGLTLPELTNNEMCSSYQLQFPEATWAGQLPEAAVSGTHTCDAKGCVLQLAPIHYTMGIRLADAAGPWPDSDDIAISQFDDDDADGFAGVSIDVVAQASVSTGQNACTTSSPNQGPGNTTPRAPSMPGAPSGPMTGRTPPTTQPIFAAPLGRLLLGLRTQLTAAIALEPSCAPRGATASDATLDIASAGCFVSDGTDPATATLSCSEDLRMGVDESLPDYVVLKSGERPDDSEVTVRKKSEGPLLQVVPLTTAGCEQVRSAQF
jgi:hypothetical protein